MALDAALESAVKRAVQEQGQPATVTTIDRLARSFWQGDVTTEQQ